MRSFLTPIKILLFILTFTGTLQAKEQHQFILDIYGSKKITADILLKKYKKDIENYIDIASDPNKLFSNKYTNKVKKISEKLTADIMHEGPFLYIKPSLIKYSYTKTIYLTIDLVDIEDNNRLNIFLTPPKENIKDPGHLLKKWDEYQKTAFLHYYSKGLFPKFDHCPAWHCLMGFEEKPLKKFAITFNTLVPKYQTQLVRVLKYDKNPQKRVAASYLLAHLKDPKKIITILIPFINDPDAEVRNSTLRVIAQTLERIIIDHFPIEKIIAATNYPNTTDRNKALCIILALADQSIYADQITKNMSKALVEHFYLKQPILHRPAYLILKKISGKSFDDHNVEAWKNWVKNIK